MEGGTATSADAVSIGLIVTELVINALKHAFAGATAAGLIIVTYETAGANWRLVVSDNGIGKPEGQTIPGLGTSIVEALAKQLDGLVEVSMAARGTTVSITHGTFRSQLPTAAQSYTGAPDRSHPSLCQRRLILKS